MFNFGASHTKILLVKMKLVNLPSLQLQSRCTRKKINTFDKRNMFFTFVRGIRTDCGVGSHVHKTVRTRARFVVFFYRSERMLYRLAVTSRKKLSPARLPGEFKLCNRCREIVRKL